MPEDASPDVSVLLVGHGTVTDLRDVPELLRRIRHGREAPPELVLEVTRRYREIGRSPLLEVSGRVAEKLSATLGIPCRVGMRFFAPLVSDVLREMCAGGLRRLVVLPLSPYSVRLYVEAVQGALRDVARGPEILPVPPYGDCPELVRAHASSIAPLLAGRSSDDTQLVFSAHSLPVRVIEAGDSYQKEFEAAAAAVSKEVGWPAEIAYQSVGAGGGEWLGPNLSAVLAGARSAGKKAVVVAPVGFLADHLETLYDLDIEAARQARELGLAFFRAPALNDDPALVGALAAVVRRTLG